MDAVLRSSDAYVSVHFRGEKIFTTPVRARTLKPLWNNAESTLIVTTTKDDEALKKTSAAATIEFRMFDRDSSFAASDYTPDADTEDDEIGRVVVSVRDAVHLCCHRDTSRAEPSAELNADGGKRTYPLKLAEGQRQVTEQRSQAPI